MFRSSLFSDSAGAAFPMSISRLEGVFGVRFKTVFTLQAAATPFHQGVYALAWQYGVQAATAPEADTHSAYVRTARAESATNVPHVRLDLSTSTMAQLTIPFLHPLEFMELNYDICLGNVAVVCLLPPKAVVGMVPPTFKLYIHLEDMELIGATSSDARSITVQSGGKLKPVEEEFENDAYPLSSTLHSASRTVKWIAKGVPSIASIAGPTSWFLGKAAGVARYLGFSKPQIQEPVMRMVKFTSALENNVDVPSSTAMVGALASNYLRVDPQFAGTDVDEMALSYVLSQWSQIHVGTISTTDAPGSVIYGAHVSPSAFWFRQAAGAPYGNTSAPTNSTADTNAFMPSSLFYWAQMFRYWKGDVEFRFTFAKTKLHGGRVAFSFFPQRDPVSNAVDQNDVVLAPYTDPVIPNGIQPFGNTVMFDLRDDNVITFVAPYVSAQPFLSFFGSVGSVAMSIVDPLQANATVASSIDFMVEVRGKPNFELAVPRGPQYAAHEAGTIKTQSGGLLATVPDNVSEYTIGESVTSVKQLIMMPTSKIQTAIFSTNGTNRGSSARLAVPPWWYRAKLSALVPLAGYTEGAFDLANNCAACYAFVRGSQDIHVYTMSSGGNLIAAASFAGDRATNNFAAGDLTNPPSTNVPRVFSNPAEPLHVRVPAHQKLSRYFSWGSNLWLTDDTPYASDTYAYIRLYATGTPTNQTFVVTSCAGDDAMLGHYMGPPPLALPPPGTTSTTYDPDSVGFQSGGTLREQSQDDIKNTAQNPILHRDSTVHGSVNAVNAQSSYDFSAHSATDVLTASELALRAIEAVYKLMRLIADAARR